MRQALGAVDREIGVEIPIYWKCKVKLNSIPTGNSDSGKSGKT